LPTTLRLVLETRLRDKAHRASSLISLRNAFHRSALDEVGEVPTSATAAWVSRGERLVSEAPNDRAARLVLVEWLGRAWRFDEAAAAVSALAEEIGDKHPATLRARNSLAGSYWSAGRTQDAITLQEQVLTDSEEVLGDKHPDTLTDRSNLASLYRSAGRTQDAITLQEQVLTDREAVLGDKHPDTLTDRSNLANSYRSAGRTQDAITLLEQVLTDSGAILGDKHPNTLTARAALAKWRKEAGSS